MTTANGTAGQKSVLAQVEQTYPIKPHSLVLGRSR